MFAEGDWVIVVLHNTFGKVVERACLWGTVLYRVWLPLSNQVVQVEPTALSSIQTLALNSHHLTYRVAAARIADALAQDVLLAPVESSVIPLPHQLRALSRAISTDRVRYLLADEVGLGKTIEAGLIMKELKLRGLVRRTLIIAPKGLVSQWVAEMAMHFNEQFHAILSEDYKSLKRIAAVAKTEDCGMRTTSLEPSSLIAPPSPMLTAHANPFTVFDQVVVSMDSVKPPSNDDGTAWERFEDLVSAGWDLIIVDEAHRLGGSTDQVARYRLGQGLADAAPYLLLLSATPHQGKTDAFYRLIALLDSQAFPDVNSVTKERVQPYVIRTEKRHAIDAKGRPLFKPRRTELAPVAWADRHRDQRLLYEAVTEYVRKGYNQAIREKRSYIGFLMILMQRLVVSSTRAIKTTLERRFEVLSTAGSRLSQGELLDTHLDADDFYDLDDEEQLQLLLQIRIRGIRDEQTEVKLLLELARRCEAQGPDAKAEALLDWIYRLQAEEGDPNLKVLVFTEFVPTQEMLYEFLTERGFNVVCLNGAMNIAERKRIQDAFANNARILISTDAGGEGLNLQFCHVVINYDIPWNPMRLEQRIGRVDRIGQTHPVRAINFVFEDSVEHRVREVLEQKLAVILAEFGIDKTGDVLDSAQAGQIFDDVYVEAILNPAVVEQKVDEVLKHFRMQAQALRQSTALLGATEDLDPREAERLLAHPIQYWVETMTTAYLRSVRDEGRSANGKKPGAEPIGKEGSHTIWHLIWPDGHEETVCFTHTALRVPHLGLEDPRVFGLAMRLPPFVPGQPIPVITLPNLAAEIIGFWSLWRISISTADWNRSRIMPLFLADNGRTFTPTARHIWDQLVVTNPTVLRHLDITTSQHAYERLWEAAERQGKTMYHELVQAQREYLARERAKGEEAFAARRRVIERIGLPQVRRHRLSRLQQEEEQFREQLERRSHSLPDMAPVLIVRVEPEKGRE
ncbi:DEAD/DEAH box helicase [Chloroflexus sp.]|uniref:DEAD/DEAH box helicase n=1 Tax=Chloroflexus sp. TaxID=1904827 RepID=UPI002ACECC6C|nr:helicase-related protein [Chloroflexus sp.]